MTPSRSGALLVEAWFASPAGSLWWRLRSRRSCSCPSSPLRVLACVVAALAAREYLEIVDTPIRAVVLAVALCWVVVRRDDASRRRCC